MSNLDSVWGSTTADSGFAEDNVPPAGYVGVPRVSDIRVGTSKKNEDYFLIELTDDQASPAYKWAIYKQLTKGGQPHAGSITSAKITLRQVGLDVAHPSQLEAVLKSIIGRYYAVEQRASDRVNPVTGEFYVNTEVTGAASPPTLNVAQAAPAPVAPAPQVQVPHAQVAQFGSAAEAFPAPGVAPQPVAVPVAEVQRSEAIQVPQAQPVQQVPGGVTSQPTPPTFPAAVPGQPATVVPQQQPAADPNAAPW